MQDIYQKMIDKYGYGDQACESIVKTEHGGITIQLCSAERVQFNPDTGNGFQGGLRINGITVWERVVVAQTK